ncbi:hypothetical protein [Larkinella punicea]|uniref:Uncharacterized protein n=1 Tax=Larkinella punicea TaxID=2315727 RepID=A0A368JI23_9BACT|nr:hypothetical protein [Larkinella punicea]RCR67192.1 hypothetical protein DUE52_23045 [Larkinella punicea]
MSIPEGSPLRRSDSGMLTQNREEPVLQRDLKTSVVCQLAKQHSGAEQQQHRRNPVSAAQQVKYI